MVTEMSVEGGEVSIAGKPLQRFKRLAGSLETLISAIAQDWENAAHKAPASEDETVLTKPIHRQMKKAQLLFTELHSTTRKMHGAVEGIRNKVAVAKQSMDLNHLQLENLLYERDHLSRETQLCKDFTMTELNQMEEDEEQAFLEDVDTVQTRDEHARNLAILKEQKDKRTNAQLELEAVQIRVKAANSAISESKQYLNKLPEYLKDVEKALVPLRKNMPWRPGARRGRHEQAADLPGPLFTLYCQLEAYCDSLLTDESQPEDSGEASSLVAYGGGGDGDPPAASVSLVASRTYVSASAKAAAEGPDDTIASSAKGGSRASPRSSPEPDGAAKRQRRHYREEDEGQGMVRVGSGEGKRRVSTKEAGRCMVDAIKPYPLEVLLTLNSTRSDVGASKGTGTSGTAKEPKSFSVRFCYLPALGVVAVSPEDSYPPSLFANLFPNDTGKDTPNPANHHGRAARASATGTFEYPSDVPCRPYGWAQWLAGLHFSPATTPSTDSAGAGGEAAATTPPIEPSTRAVVAALRSRMRTHVSLAGQLKSFATTGPSPLPGSEGEVPEVTGGMELRSWKEISGSELQQAAKTFRERDFARAGTGTEGSGDREEWERHGARYFKGVLKMKKGGGREKSVDLRVEVPAEYPLRPSLVSLADTGNALVDEELRTISNEVNAHYDTLLTEDVARWDHLLSHQLILVMECLATRAAGGCSRLRRGRMRRKAVLFDRLERTFVHR